MYNASENTLFADLRGLCRCMLVVIAECLHLLFVTEWVQFVVPAVVH